MTKHKVFGLMYYCKGCLSITDQLTRKINLSKKICFPAINAFMYWQNFERDLDVGGLKVKGELEVTTNNLI
jgi:hypothetical protein